MRGINMISRELKLEYESILLGKKKNYSTVFFGTENKERNQENALNVMRYAFESFLGWTPQDIYNCINMEILDTMKLDSLLKHIEFPSELSIKNDLNYIAHMLYPSVIPFNTKKRVISIYNQVLEKKLYRYPKDFLEGSDGILRAKICLKYVLQNYLLFHNIEEMYEFFASKEGVKALKEYQLFVASNTLFESHIDYLHETLSENQQNEFLYHYYKFCQEFKKNDEIA